MIHITINPFIQEIVFEKYSSKQWHKAKIVYEDIDEWGAITLDGIVYDYHLLYDSGLSISIYNVIDGKADYENTVKTKVKVIY